MLQWNSHLYHLLYTATAYYYYIIMPCNQYFWLRTCAHHDLLSITNLIHFEIRPFPNHTSFYHPYTLYYSFLEPAKELERVRPLRFLLQRHQQRRRPLLLPRQQRQQLGQHHRRQQQLQQLPRHLRMEAATAEKPKMRWWYQQRHDHQKKVALLALHRFLGFNEHAPHRRTADWEAHEPE